MLLSDKQNLCIVNYVDRHTGANSMKHYYLWNGKRIEFESICYSTSTGEYYDRPSETWVVGIQPGHTRRSVLVRAVDNDVYHLITVQDLYSRIESIHRIIAMYAEDGLVSLEQYIEPLLTNLRRYVFFLYLVADGDPSIKWLDNDTNNADGGLQ
jgi:hypothetical protein